LIGRLLGAAGLAVLAGCANPLPPQVLVVGDVTETGRKLAPPTADQPVYYFPLVVGYKEVGGVIAGEKQPAKNDVSHALAVALAKQHYLLMDAQHAPGQLLVFWWGSMNPQIEDFGSNDPTQQVFFNEREMLALVGAYKTTKLAPWDSDRLRTAARDDRYFVIVMAFDFAAARRHEKKLLWMAKMSTESVGTDLPAVFPALIASGGPAFGRDTAPGWIDSGQPPKEEKVILGPAEYRDYVPPPAPEKK